MIFALNSDYYDYPVGPWCFPWTVTIMTIQLDPDFPLNSEQ